MVDMLRFVHATLIISNYIVGWTKRSVSTRRLNGSPIHMTRKIIKRRLEKTALNSHALHPLLQRIYATRGIASNTELDRGLNALLPFNDLLGIDQAVSLLADAIRQQQKILIVGDFDADGATSTAVAVRALREFGAQYVDSDNAPIRS